MKVLIAEDDLTSRTMLDAVIKKWGYQTVSVADGDAAWEVIQQSDAPQLMLIDWEMPKLNGIDLCKRIRQQQTENQPFIILLTARTDTDDVVEGLLAGANDYIAKPFENAELQARLGVGQRMLELQNQLYNTKMQLSKEQSIVENIINKMHLSNPLSLENLRKLEIPVDNVSGDILLSMLNADSVQFVMLGDFTGHGLTAAIGGPTVSDTFYSMIKKGLPMAAIISEINQKLFEKMPTGIFCGAIFIELSSNKTQASIWNCGMESVLVYRDHELLREISSNRLALGIIENPQSSPVLITLEADDKIFAFSDGITETLNAEGEELGEQGLQQAIKRLLDSESDISKLAETVEQFRGDGKQLDDITLVELSC